MYGYCINGFVLANHVELSVISVMRGLKWRCGFNVTLLDSKNLEDQLYTFKLTPRINWRCATIIWLIDTIDSLI